MLKDKTYTQEDVDKSNSPKLAYLNYLDTVCIDDIEPENQPWLWDGVIPLCAFTLFAGVGGIGKSQLLMFIAAYVSTGKPFQAGGMTHQLPQGSVIILSAEDSQKYSISPRLRALGADTKKIHKINSVSNSKEPFKKRLMALDQDIQLLKSKILELKAKGEEVKLIIIDPVVNFIGKTKDYINTEVSNFLYGLTDLSEELHLSIILNKHLRKKDSQSASSAVDEIAGSSAWSNTARQVWVICRDHEDKKKILFLDGKSNIKQEMTGLAFNINSEQIYNKQNQPIKTSKIEWLQEIVTISPDEAVSAEKYEKNKMKFAQDFIVSYLDKNGERAGEDVRDAAISSKISKTTYFDALNLLVKNDQVVRKPGFSKQKYTLLLP